MTDNFENKVAVDGPVVNEGELGSSTFTPGQVSPAGPLGLGQRWTVTRKREVALRLLRGEPVELLSRQLGVEIFTRQCARSSLPKGRNSPDRRRSQDGHRAPARLRDPPDREGKAAAEDRSVRCGGSLQCPP